MAAQTEGREQDELFQSLDALDRFVLRERRASQELLDQHMAARRRDLVPINALMAWIAPGSAPLIERFAVDYWTPLHPLAVDSR